MYVKLAFSVAAHLDSEIMIMDEVLAVGDMAFQKKCLDKMREAATRDGRTVLYVSHNMNTIRQLCERCIVLEKGKVVYDGDVEEAIEVYTHSLGRAQAYYEYSEEYHSDPRSNSSFVIRSLSTNDGQDPVCDYGGSIPLTLNSFSQKALKQVFFRFEAQFQDQAKVGTMFSDRGTDFQAGENRSIQMVLDTTHLAPGRFFVNIIAYQFNEFGKELFLDGVYPGLVLEVSETINEKNKLVWNHRYWGHVHLNDVNVVE